MAFFPPLSQPSPICDCRFFFSFIGGWLAFWKDPAILFGFPIALVAGAAFALGVTAFLGVLILLFPSIRSQAEAVSFSLPILSLMGNFDPGADSFTLQLLSVTGLTVIFLVVNLYAGTWLDRFLPRRNAIYRAWFAAASPQRNFGPTSA